jgi:UDP:flavonoid glycosyltransferase YjiC (YdhE family)
MRVGIQGWGSEGDLRPLVALAARLHREGHSASLVVTPVDGKDYRPLCDALGISLTTVPDRVEITVQQIAQEAKSANPTKLITKVLALTFDPYVEPTYEAARDLCARSDVVVAGPSCWTLKAASLATRTPHAIIDYVPGVVPSRLIPPDFLPPWRWLARPGWALLSVLMDMAFAATPRRFFAAKGLPRIRHVIPDVVFSDHLNLHAASPSFWPPAPDWAETHCVCGELAMPDDAEPWAPSSALRSFLNEGPPPVLLSLGSWEHIVQDRGLDLLLASARASGLRAIVQTKRSDVEVREGETFILPWAPHRRLAPMCCAVVHHGGAGTTHMALRAGKPALVLPFILEQRMWAKRLARCGAGRWLSFWKATPERVGALMREVVSSVALRERAERMASSMVNEDGAGVAVRRLEVLAAASTASPDSKPRPTTSMGERRS